MKKFLTCTAMALAFISLAAQDLPVMRTDHPRLFFNHDTWPELQKRAEGPARQYLDALIEACDKMPDNPVCTGTGPLTIKEGLQPDGTYISFKDTPIPAIKEFGTESAMCALAWRFTGDAKYLEKAKKMLFESVRGYTEATENRRPVSWYSTSRICAICAYDWIYDELSDSERRAFIIPMLKHVEEVQPSFGLNIPRTNISDPASTGFYGANALFWYAGIAAAGDGFCDEQAARQLAEGHRLNTIMMNSRNESAGDDGGLITAAMNYSFAEYPRAHFCYIYTFRSAFGVDIAVQYPEMALMPNWIWWMWIRDDSNPGEVRTAGQGDVYHTTNTGSYRQMYEHLTHYINVYRDIDPVSAKLALSLREHAPSKSMGAVFPVFPFLVDENPEGMTAYSRAQMEDCPVKARHFEQLGQILMRSGWNDDATYCTFTAGTVGLHNHKHFDENNFIIYKYDHLAVDTGDRARQNDFNLAHYYSQSVAHNVVLINKPGEALPDHWGLKSEVPEEMVNDGGMYENISAKVLAFETNPQFSYVASDATECYGSKCTEAVRQFVHVQPDYFVVYDRVGAQSASYPKRWLLHTVNEPVVKGRMMEASCGEGKLFSQTLLPAGAKITKVGGPGKEFWSNGRNWPINRDYLDEMSKKVEDNGRGPYYGAWRIEVKPSGKAVDDRFLHVLTAAGKDAASAVQATLVQDKNRDGVKMIIDGKEMTFWFNRKGEVGGSVVIDGKERALSSQVQVQSGVVMNALDIPDLEPRADFWKVRPNEIMKLCAGVKKGRSEVIAHTPLGYPVYAVFYGPFNEAAPQTNWSAGNSSSTVKSYLGDKPDLETVMILAGVHGAEPEGVAGAVNLIQMLETGKDFRGETDPELLELISKYRVIIIPCANMDGRSICPDHLRGQPFEVFRAASQGTWKDGSLVGWRGSKEWFPLPLDKVSFPGGYPNSEGYNIMHDANPGDMKTAECAAIVRLAGRWRVDCVINLHSCEYQSHMLPPTVIDTPEHVDKGMEIQVAVNDALFEAGLRTEPVKDVRKPSNTINMNNLLELASGANAQTLEMSVSYDDVHNPTRIFSFEELMMPALVTIKTILKSGVEKPFNDR